MGNKRNKIATLVSIFISIFLMAYFASTILHGFPFNPDIPSLKYPDVGEIYSAIQQKKIDWMKVGEIYGDKKVGESFISERPNLDRVDILFSTFGDRKNTHDYVFHLRTDEKTSIDLRTVIFNAKSVSDAVYMNIVFPEISDSQGKKYYFFIESPTSKPSNALTVWYVLNSSNYPEGKFYINNETASGNLAFRTYYKTNFIDFVTEFLDRIATFKPAFITPLTLMILFVSLLFLFVLASILLTQSGLRAQEDHVL